MHRWQRHFWILILFLSLCLLSSCRANTPVEDSNLKPPDPAKVPAQNNDGSAIVSETMGHFRVQSYTATVNISKVYKSGRRYDDVLRMYSKLNSQDHLRVLITIKPKAERQGSGMLVEMKNNELVSASRLVPEAGKVVTANPKQRSTSVVIGGLSLQDFQLLHGVSPFAEMRIAGREEVNGKSCDVLDVVFADQSHYHTGQLLTTVDERLPVFVRVFNRQGALIKEIMFDKVQQIRQVWVVKQLTVVEKSFDYTSTFEFTNVNVNSPLEDSIFTAAFLQKGWQDSSERAH